MFEFKQFRIEDGRCGMKLSTDSVLLGAWANASAAVAQCVDLGCGSGVLALMMAQRCGANIVGVELDEGACLDARDNVDASPWADRIDIVCADALTWQPSKPVDLVISNPPFFTETLRSPDGKRAQARHGSDTAVLNPYTVLDFAKRHLADDGTVAMIFPTNQLSDITFHAEMIGLKLRRRYLVSAVDGRPPMRALVQFSRHDGPIDANSLSIRTPDNRYTDAYVELTKDFYLRLNS